MSIKKDILKYSGSLNEEQLLEDDELVSKELEAESRLLEVFSRAVNGIKSMKWLVKGNMGIPYGSDDMDSMRDVMKAKMVSQELKNKLKLIADAKMKILQYVIDDAFGPSEKEREEAEEMEHEHEEEEE